MTWMIVVLFQTITGDVYIFTDPTFETREACMASVYNPEDQKRYVAKLTHEYGRVMPILAVNCLEKDTIQEILEKQNTDTKA